MISVAAYVFPEFIQVPATSTSGAEHSSVPRGSIAPSAMLRIRPSVTGMPITSTSIALLKL